MADTRIFRMTRVHREHRTRRVIESTVWYGNKRVASAKCGGGGYSYQYGAVEKVEATNAEATEGWTDVTNEFIKESK
jgi:hypothetical protein